MRWHYFLFLYENGQPLKFKKIDVSLASSEIPTWIFPTKNTTIPIKSGVLTNENGFFEFWVADKLESLSYGYLPTQTFKISCENKVIDNINIIGSITQDWAFKTSPITIPKNSYNTSIIKMPLIRGLIYYLKVEPSNITDLYDIEFLDTNGIDVLYKSTNLPYNIAWEDRWPFYLKSSNGNVFCRIRNTDFYKNGIFTI